MALPPAALQRNSSPPNRAVQAWLSPLPHFRALAPIPPALLGRGFPPFGKLGLHPTVLKKHDSTTAVERHGSPPPHCWGMSPPYATVDAWLPPLATYCRGMVPRLTVAQVSSLPDSAPMVLKRPGPPRFLAVGAWFHPYGTVKAWMAFPSTIR